MTGTQFNSHTLLAEKPTRVGATIKIERRPVMPFYDREADVIYVSTNGEISAPGRGLRRISIRGMSAMTIRSSLDMNPAR